MIEVSEPNAIRNEERKVRRICILAVVVELLTDMIVMYSVWRFIFPNPDWNDRKKIGALRLNAKSCSHWKLMTEHSFWVHCCVSNFSLQKKLVFFPFAPQLRFEFLFDRKKIARNKNYNVSRIGYLRNSNGTVTVFGTFRILNFSGMDFYFRPD